MFFKADRVITLGTFRIRCNSCLGSSLTCLYFFFFFFLCCFLFLCCCLDSSHFTATRLMVMVRYTIAFVKNLLISLLFVEPCDLQTRTDLRCSLQGLAENYWLFELSQTTQTLTSQRGCTPEKPTQKKLVRKFVSKLQTKCQAAQKRELGACPQSWQWGEGGYPLDTVSIFVMLTLNECALNLLQSHSTKT